ncbi:hypothetical protein WJX84_005098 [Apatococcus fuscideae]|uniref:F-box domain-containing protein n=1 Tax=Apatococcus fuscideae TaxID=2026836 RepID=A0AAW1T7C3_9CHLO
MARRRDLSQLSELHGLRSQNRCKHGAMDAVGPVDICSFPIQDALRTHLLPFLTPAFLAHLRSPCRTLQELVDKRTGAIWRDAAQSVLPLESLPEARDGYAVQARLALHAEMAHKLTQGGPKTMLLMRLDSSPFLKDLLSWGPCSPMNGLSWSLQQGATSFDLRPTGKLEPPLAVNLASQLAAINAVTLAANPIPAPSASIHATSERMARAPGGAQGAGDSGHVADARVPATGHSGKVPKRDVLWCSWQGEHGHLVYLQTDQNPNQHQDQKQLMSVDTSSGALTKGPVMNGYHYDIHKASLRSPGGTAIMLLTESDAYAVLDLPSLHTSQSVNILEVDVIRGTVVLPDSMMDLEWHTDATSLMAGLGSPLMRI